MIDYFAWANANQGVLSILIFFITILFGWLSGIFSSLRRRPKFKLALLEGPNFCVTFHTGKKLEGHETHRVAISLYLNVSNIGSAPSSIANVSIGYHWHVSRFSLAWARYGIFWFWLRHPSVSLRDFQHVIGDHLKLYPFLIQTSAFSGASADTYLNIGQSINGVVYFEQGECLGGCFPSPTRKGARIRVAVTDVLGVKHKRTFWIPIVDITEAKDYNPSFGETLATLHGEVSSAPEDVRAAAD